MSRVCIIGLDGATFRVIDYLAGKGEMPAFSALAGEGARSTLLSTRPPLTPAAWASFYTGFNPGNHGVVDFFHRVPGTYRLSPVNAGSIHGIPLWKRASAAGMRVCVYNVPMTYPAAEVNGIMIAGMDAPRLDERAVHPADFREKLLEAVPGFSINPPVDAKYIDNNHPDPTGEYIAQLEQHLEMELGTIRYLMNLEDWDLFVGGIRSTDTLQHVFWESVEKVITGSETTAEDERRAEAGFACYRDIDRELGSFWREWASGSDVIILSDHGFGLLRSEVCVNRLLADAGLLAFRRKGFRRRAKEKIFDAAQRRLPPRARRKIKQALGKEAEGGRAGILFVDALVADIDWSRTRIYSRGQFGCLFVNKKGREPMGMVDPGEVPALLRETREVLSSVKDPRDGEKIVTDFFPAEELYSGARMEMMPDMVVVMRDYLFRGIYSTFAEFRESALVRPPQPERRVLKHSGNHRQEGVLLMQGPDIGGSIADGASIEDVAPTVLRLLGLPGEEECDGKVLEQALTGEAAAPPAPAASPGDPGLSAQEEAGGTLDNDDEEEIRRRLEDLGYL